MAPFKRYEQLSELVKMYPCLYNKQEKDFKKEEVKQRAWKEIAKELDLKNGKVVEQVWKIKKMLSKRRPKLKEIDASVVSDVWWYLFGGSELAIEIYWTI